VDLQKIKNQLVHEASKNPKKAVFAGLLLVVGLYFWIPLVWGWMNKDCENVELPGATQTVINAQESPKNHETETTVKETEKTSLSWKALVRLINNDPRMHPAESLKINRDPFRDPRDAIAKKIDEEEQAKEKLPPASPASLGLNLTSTIIGPQGSIARIAGKTYSLGQTIEMRKEGRNFKFTITEIRDRRVLLEAEGESFELSIPEPGNSDRMVFGNN
jgi:hypothetical protein